jgi:hypothetical protein
VSKPNEPTAPGGWSSEGAEALLCTLPGVLSARVVARPGGIVDAVHLLTTEELPPEDATEMTVRALEARYELKVDPGKVEITRTKVATGMGLPRAGATRRPEEFPVRLRDIPGPDRRAEVPGGVGEAGEPAEAKGETASPAPEPMSPPSRSRERGRILLQGHEVELVRPQRVHTRVSLEWKGRTHLGEASGPDLPRPRLELLARATLQAIQGIVHFEAGDANSPPPIGLDLDGVRLVDAFDRTIALVAVHCQHEAEINTLAGSVVVADSVERAVVLATLQATNRWVRGRM